jgi:hypothetical protein
LTAQQRACRVTAGNAFLDWGQAHQVRVRARNSQGASDWVLVSGAVPFAPPFVLAVVDEGFGGVGVGVIPGNRMLMVGWESGAFDVVGVRRGADVSRVEVRASMVDGRGRVVSRACAVSRPRVGQFPTSCSVSGLVNDTIYTVWVRAQNRAGWSDWVAVPADVADRTPVPVAPSVVRSLRVVPRSGELAVSWTAPANDGGAPPVYDVQVRRVGDDWAGGVTPAVEDLACAGLTAQQRACRVTAGNAFLDWGQAHQVRVRARNSQGASDWVLVSGAVPFSVPTLNGFLIDVMPADRMLTVNWDQEALDVDAVARGGLVARLEVRAVPTGAGRVRACAVARDRTGTLAGSCAVTGLDNGNSYTIEMRAQNRAGWTPWSPLDGSAVVREGLRAQNVHRWTPSPVPPLAAAPVNVLAGAGVAEIRVEWGPPASGGGSPITGYRVLAKRADDPEGPAGVCETSENECSIIGLDDEVDYLIQVAARNGAGYGDVASTPTLVRTLPPIGLDRNLAAPGSELEVWAGGFLPGSRVVIDLDGRSEVLAEQVADPTGRIEALVVLPDDLASGEFSIRASGQSRTAAERAVRASLVVDGVAPVVGSLVLSVGELDVSEGPGEFSVSLVVEDDLSGVESVWVSVENPAGVQMLGSMLELVEGDERSGVWRATFTVPRYAMAGEWRVNTIGARDRAFNEVYVRGEDLELLGPPGVLVGSGTIDR